MKLKPRTEREITRDIVDAMQYMGYTAIRCVAGPVRSMRDGQEIPEQSNPPGFPDWCFVRTETRFVAALRDLYMPDTREQGGADVWFMEIKAHGKRPAPLQLAWLERLRKDGFTADWYDGFRAPEGQKPFMEGRS